MWLTNHFYLIMHPAIAYHVVSKGGGVAPLYESPTLGLCPKNPYACTCATRPSDVADKTG